MRFRQSSYRLAVIWQRAAARHGQARPGKARQGKAGRGVRAIDRSEPEGDTPARLYSLVHVEAGPVATFLTREEAEEELQAVLRDKPAWKGDLGSSGANSR